MTAPGREDVHLSIGEVLQHLHDEFPDVTVSKIRFLESQGLIDPERTPSGYRRFYSPDVERLRWILFQQREHFLPLKVIKERLDTFGGAGAPPLESTNGDRPAVAELEPRPIVAREGTLPLPLDREDEVEPGPVPPDDTNPQPADLSRADLLAAAHLGDHALEELEGYGLVTPLVGHGDNARYDEEALATARAAAAFYEHGLTARHLRMYLHFAEREAALFTQTLLPYRRQRNPLARARLEAELGQLAAGGARLRTLMLRRVLRDTIDE